MSSTPFHTKLPNGGSSPTDGCENELARLRARVDQLEDLCGELYDLGVEVGVPQIFLNKLWTVASHGNEPRAFGIDLQGSHSGAGAAAETHSVAHDDGLPDVRLVHSIAEQKWSRTPRRKLAALPERRRVMVVDDDPAILTVILRVLAQENYEVLSANSGPEALEMLSGPIDLLITDYVMPVMNGRQLAEQMRRRHPDVRVLYQTGFTDLLFKHQRETERYAAFLEKPYSARGLIEAARLALFGYIQPPEHEKSA